MFTAKDFEVARAIKPGINLARLDPSAYAWLKIAQNANGSSTVYDATISNGIAYFDRVVASQPLVSLKLNLPVTQTGSGTPAPDNIRDFIGVDTIRVNMVDFNQIADNNRAPTSRNGLTITGGLDGFTIDGTATADTSAIGWFKLDKAYEEYMAITGHKVFVSLQLLSGTITKDEGKTRSLYFGLGGNTENVYIDGNGNTIVNPIMISSSTSALIVLNGTKFENAKIGLNCIDITEAFGSRIADSIYNMEQQTQGAGVALVKQIFYKDYYAYNVGGSWVSVASVNGDSYPDYAEVQIGTTIYGGAFDVLTGILSITHAIVDLGSLSWQYGSGSQVFYTEDIADMSEAIPFDNMTCSAFEVLSSRISLANMTNYAIKRGNSESTKKTIYVKDTDYTDADAFTTAVTGMKLVYGLETPIEIQLTPTQITTLIGENVIFADVADVTECKYTRK